MDPETRVQISLSTPLFYSGVTVLIILLFLVSVALSLTGGYCMYQQQYHYVVGSALLVFVFCTMILNETIEDLKK